MDDVNFLFVGPQRTGTTWFYEHLKQHPSLCFPKGVKETMFFDKNYKKGLEWYHYHFKVCKDRQIWGEVAPTYFSHKQVPERIKSRSPKCKIIISLRDPVERARSLFQHHYQKGRVPDSFSEAIKTKPVILTSGYYEIHIKRWFNYFNKDQILVITTNQIKNNPVELLKNICEFIEIDIAKLPNEVKQKKINTAQRPRNRNIAKIGSDFVTYLHSMRLHWLVNLPKKIGLKKIFFKESDEKPDLTKAEIEFLKEKYADHIKYVHKKFKNITL